MAIVVEVNGWVYEVASNNGQHEMLVAFVRELFGEPITVIDEVLVSRKFLGERNGSGNIKTN